MLALQNLTDILSFILCSGMFIAKTEVDASANLFLTTTSIQSNVIVHVHSDKTFDKASSNLDG